MGTALAAPLHFRRTAATRPAEGILHAAQAADTDLVVVLARPRSFWGKLFSHSVTAQVLLRSPVPVLVLPTLT